MVIDFFVWYIDDKEDDDIIEAQIEMAKPKAEFQEQEQEYNDDKNSLEEGEPLPKKAKQIVEKQPPALDVKKEEENFTYITSILLNKSKKLYRLKEKTQRNHETSMMRSALVHANLTVATISRMFKNSPPLKLLTGQRTKNVLTNSYKEHIRTRLKKMWEIYAPPLADVELLLNVIFAEGDWFLTQQQQPTTTQNTGQTSALIQIPLKEMIKSTKTTSEEPNLSAILTQIMNDGLNPVTSSSKQHIQPPPLATAKDNLHFGPAAKVKPSAIKECCNLLHMEVTKLDKHAKIDFYAFHSSLFLLARYAEEKVLSDVQKATWSPEEIVQFGHYVISVLAISGKSHYALKNLYDLGKKTNLKSDICMKASKYLCEQFDQDKIATEVWTYFSSGYFKAKHTKTKEIRNEPYKNFYKHHYFNPSLKTKKQKKNLQASLFFKSLKNK